MCRCLKDLCKDDGETPNSIAKLIGASSGSVTAWKNGSAPRNATLSKIADHFNVSTDYLLGKEDNLSILHLTDSQQKDLLDLFNRKMNQKDLTEAEVISQSKAGYNFFPRLAHFTLHRVRENNLLSAAKFLNIDGEVKSIVGLPTSAQAAGESSAPKVSDHDIKFALFRGREGITDEMYKEVLSFAEYVARREEEKRNKE